MQILGLLGENPAQMGLTALPALSACALPAVHREVCPWRRNLLRHSLLAEAALPARPPPHRRGVRHPGGGLSLSCRGLHAAHHCDQDAV